MKTPSLATRLASLAVVALLWFLPVVASAASVEDEGKLVHVADTRHLTGFNLYIANLYNTDRLLFTLFAVGLTAALGLALGLLMDGVVAAIGLDLERQQTRE